MSFVIMTVGKTHSGKTTFGKEIAKKLKHVCLLDSDEIAEFLRDKYPDLYDKDFVKGSNELASGYHLKRMVVLDVYRQALKTKLPIISTSANSTKKIRTEVRRLAKKSGRKVIMVYFNLPETLLVGRIKASQRSQKCLYHSKDFIDLLVNKQKQRFEAPNKKEADYFLEITDEVSGVKAFKEVIKLLKEQVV